MNKLPGKLTSLAILIGSLTIITGFVKPVRAQGPSIKNIAANSKKERPSPYPPSPYKIVIDKSDFELKVYDQDGWLATYPVVFGNKKQEDKKMEGDRLTPNGKFKITFKKYHKEWGCFMLLDYPTGESFERFKERKKKGAIPKSATIGGGIGIHGTRPHEEYAVDKFINWTNGCISTKYSDIFELYDLVPLGTEVVVQE
jgi:murein L,D-transpeptidase YafK